MDHGGPRHRHVHVLRRARDVVDLRDVVDDLGTGTVSTVAISTVELKKFTRCAVSFAQAEQLEEGALLGLAPVRAPAWPCHGISRTSGLAKPRTTLPQSFQPETWLRETSCARICKSLVQRGWILVTWW